MGSNNPFSRTPGIGLFLVFVFILTSAPRMNVKIGPIPIYAIDIILFLAILTLPRGRDYISRKRPFQNLVLFLLSVALLSEIASWAYGGSLLDSVYLMGRISLSFAVFFLTGLFVQNPKDLELVLKTTLLGLLITSVLMILTSLPMTRNAVVNTIFSNQFLEPAASRASLAYAEVDPNAGRGRTLVGVSIMGATFLNVMWPLSALLLRWPYGIGWWKRLAFFGCLLAPIAVLMSYSRGPILGSILLVLVTLLLGLGRIRRGILVPVTVLVCIVMVIGVESNLFFFDRLERRTIAVFEDPFADERESERILAYVEPFQHVVENPQFFLIGEGTAITKKIDVRPEQAGKATHSLFAKSYYTNGLVAAFCYMFLLVNAAYFALWHVRHRRRSLGAFYSQALLLSVVALLPWAVFGHAIVSTPRGAMMFFFVLGLLSSLRHFPIEENVKLKRGIGNGNRRTASV